MAIKLDKEKFKRIDEEFAAIRENKSSSGITEHLNAIESDDLVASFSSLIVADYNRPSDETEILLDELLTSFSAVRSAEADPCHHGVLGSIVSIRSHVSDAVTDFVFIDRKTTFGFAIHWGIYLAVKWGALQLAFFPRMHEVLERLLTSGDFNGNPESRCVKHS